MKIDLDQTDCLIVKGSTVLLSGVVAVLSLGVAGVGIFAALSGYPGGWFAVLAAGVIGGGILWLVYNKTEAVFDRVGNRLTVRKSMLHGARKEVVSLDEVQQADVDLQRNKNSNNRLHPSYTYRLCLVTGSDQARHRMPLSHGFTTSKRHLVTARKINAWLGVPDAPIAAGPSMADVARVIKSLGFGKAS